MRTRHPPEFRQQMIELCESRGGDKSVLTRIVDQIVSGDESAVGRGVPGRAEGD